MQEDVLTRFLPMQSDRQESIATRHSLLERLKEWRNDADWRDFFEAYWELVYNVARRRGLTDTEAQEVVQETIIGVARKIGEFKTGAEHGSFKSWLLKQTGWRIADQFRKRAQWPQVVSDSGNASERSCDDARTSTLNRIPDPAGSDLDQAWDHEWEQHLLRTALEAVKAKVSTKQFQMFDLQVMQGLLVREAARTLGTTVSAAYMAKSRVGRLLRRELLRLNKVP